MGFPGGSDGKESPCNVGHPGLIPELGRSSGEGNGNSSIPWIEDPGRLQSMGHKESDTTERLSLSK